jgi:hypothetical protein
MKAGVSPIGHTGSRPDDTSSAPHESRAYRVMISGNAFS